MQKPENYGRNISTKNLGKGVYTYMEVIYRAYDGREFDDKYKCEEYENSYFHQSLFNITFYTIDGDPYYIEQDDMFNDNIYYSCERIDLLDYKQVEDLAWLTEETGWIEFDQLDAPGVWIRHDNGLEGGEWERVSDTVDDYEG